MIQILSTPQSPSLSCHCLLGPTKESLSLLYKAFVRPVLTYASPGWFPFFVTLQPITWKFYTELHAGSLLVASFPPPSSLLLLEAQLPPLKLTLEHQTSTPLNVLCAFPPTSPAFMPWQLRNVPCRLKKKPSCRSFCSSATQPLHPHASL